MSESLLTTNPDLRDARARQRALWISAASASAVEGICKPFAKPKATSARKVESQPATPRKSTR